MNGSRIAGLMLGLMLAGAAPGLAQSVYGCTGLDDRNSMPSLEGDRGVFYRIDPDMRMFHAFSDESIAQLAGLSKALKSLGTTLVYVPLPTKGLAMPAQLPQAARDYGFDVVLATTVYDQSLRRLDEAGVVTANLRTALSVDADSAPSMYPTDYRLTAAGSERAAKAIAATLGKTTGFADLPQGQFATSVASKQTLPSDMRAALQRHCQITLPELVVDSFATIRLQGTAAANNTALLGSTATSARIAVVGTEHTGEASSNFAGYLSQASGLDVQQYTVMGGGSFAAISSYLTSRAFQEQRPAYLVWINPVENNLAQFGDQPLRELKAAAAGTCRVPLPAGPGITANSVTADLSALDRTQNYTLFVDAEGTAARRAQFDFQSAAGLVRTRTVTRHPDQVATGRFYMPMSAMWPEGALAVTITLDVPAAAPVRVTACFD
jgi:alginate biosynthesis protein AlgX